MRRFWGDPLIAKNVLHAGASGFGLFGTYAAVGGVLGGVYSSRLLVEDVPAHGTAQHRNPSRWIEHQTGWSIRKFIKTARRYRTIQIQAG